MTDLLPTDELVETGIITENGQPMLALERVEAPVRPDDATHLGPAGDYWRLVLDDAARKAHASLWLGHEWMTADALFIAGIRRGITFETVSDMRPVSYAHMMVNVITKRFGLN